MQPVNLYAADLRLTESPRYARYCNITEIAEPPLDVAVASLWLDPEGLMLINPALSPPLRLSSSLLERRAKGESLLLRATGLSKGGGTVLDAFAGFGLDALTMVHAGAEASAVERNPLVWLMMAEYAERLGLPLETCCEDSAEVLQDTERVWDVVYLDPMFPTRRKRALPNLALQHLQSLSAAADALTAADVEAWLALAQACATRRVVLKRRPKEPVVGKPSHQVQGQSVRFDVYV